MRIVQVFNGEEQLLTEVVEVPQGETLLLRVMTGSVGGHAWVLEVEIGEWNGLPRIVSVKTEDSVGRGEKAGHSVRVTDVIG